MPLTGVVPFPPEFAKRYREKGYWQDKSLAQEFAAVFQQFRSRVALIDGDRAESNFSYIAAASSARRSSSCKLASWRPMSSRDSFD